MTRHLKADVLIVGGGPVGLSIAMELDARGVTSIVVERRRFKELPSPKCNHVAARTMERFRTLGVADKLRANGLPAEFEHSVAFRTSMTGIEMSRVYIPARTHRFTDHTGPDGNWPTPEPPHRINQIYLEPILNDHVAGLSHVTLVNRTDVTGFTQDDDGVLAQATDLDSNEAVEVSAQYIVGCEGGRSMVRKAIGATLSGTPVIQNVQSTCIRAPELLAMVGTPAWGVYAMNPRRSGTVYAIDGIETWLIHNYLLPSEESFDAVDRDRAIRNILGVGPEFTFEILSNEDWTARRLVADHFRDRRAFIAGDAAHLWVPYAGFGMNAGIADGLNLAWALAATVQGWAGPAMLDAYERERLPITEQVSRFAMNHAQAMNKMRGAVSPHIEDDGPEGEAIRAATGKASYDLNVQQFAAAGLNFGYFYDASPVIRYDDEKAPDYSMGSFTESTVPGCRAPHFWLADGRSLYDAFGTDFTLLRSDAGVDAAPLIDAFAARGVPLTLVDIGGEARPAAYRHMLVLCRVDQHVVWRGDEVPDDAVALIDQVRGAASTRTAVAPDRLRA